MAATAAIPLDLPVELLLLPPSRSYFATNPTDDCLPDAQVWRSGRFVLDTLVLCLVLQPAEQDALASAASAALNRRAIALACGHAL